MTKNLLIDRKPASDDGRRVNLTPSSSPESAFINTCTVTSVTRNLKRRRASIGRMVAAGLRVTVNTDDPAMFKTDLADSYQRLFASQAAWGAEQARRFSLDGIEASWLDDGEKRRWRARFAEEIAALDAAA